MVDRARQKEAVVRPRARAEAGAARASVAPIVEGGFPTPAVTPARGPGRRAGELFTQSAKHGLGGA
eukprot:4282708-Alexandrium_andersonii.AAC.1